MRRRYNISLGINNLPRMSTIYTPVAYSEKISSFLMIGDDSKEK